MLSLLLSFSITHCGCQDMLMDVLYKILKAFVSSSSQLYELDRDPKRKEFLDDLFSFMQKRGM